METIVVERVMLKDGRYASKYPDTTPFWNMNGYYVYAAKVDAMVKLTDEEVLALVP
jgi:hypothetical protein